MVQKITKYLQGRRAKIEANIEILHCDLELCIGACPIHKKHQLNESYNELGEINHLLSLIPVTTI